MDWCLLFEAGIMERHSASSAFSVGCDISICDKMSPWRQRVPSVFWTGCNQYALFHYMWKYLFIFDAFCWFLCLVGCYCRLVAKGITCLLCYFMGGGGGYCVCNPLQIYIHKYFILWTVFSEMKLFNTGSVQSRSAHWPTDLNFWLC
jgi:hypothetical protein